MGADIHWQFQKFDDATQRWYEIPAHYNGDRNYELFNILAGVRGDCVPKIAPPRGLPAHITDNYVPVFLAKPGHEHWLGDHSFSYFTNSELLAWWHDKCGNMRLHWNGDTHSFFEEIERLQDVYGDFLFVFGFDS